VWNYDVLSASDTAAKNKPFSWSSNPKADVERANGMTISWDAITPEMSLVNRVILCYAAISLLVLFSLLFRFPIAC
jgi:hypothetical protein